MKSYSWLAAALAVALAVGAQVAPAQDLRGKVGGTVADASGAVIPGASVTLANDNTNVSSTTQTSAAGQYLFDFVLPGTYTLTVESE